MLRVHALHQQTLWHIVTLHTGRSKALQSVERVRLPCRPTPGVSQRSHACCRLWLLHVPGMCTQRLQQLLTDCNMRTCVCKDLEQPSAARPGSSSNRRAHTQSTPASERWHRPGHVQLQALLQSATADSIRTTLASWMCLGGCRAAYPASAPPMPPLCPYAQLALALMAPAWPLDPCST